MSLNGGKTVEKKSCVVYGNKSTTRPWFENVNFRKKNFLCVTFLCTSDDVINYRGGVRGTKNRIVFVEFQSECYVKISSTGNDV